MNETAEMHSTIGTYSNVKVACFLNILTFSIKFDKLYVLGDVDSLYRKK